MNVVEIIFYTLILWGAVSLTNALQDATGLPSVLVSLSIVVVFVVLGDLAARLRRSSQGQ
ncbi:MAG: hypothetical protein ACF8GE_04350 [Phycisphaerales bacterium JB043]